MHDLGDTVKLTAKSVDAAGNPANATTVATTVTLPDGTTASPSGSYGATGTYTASYVPTQAGRHSWRMTFTGVVPDQAYGDVFNVWPLAGLGIVGLAETKEHLNISLIDATYDEELRRAIAGASAVVEGIVGAVARRTVTEVFSGSGADKAYLGLVPVISITTVVEDGATLPAESYSLHGSIGVLTRLQRRGWPIGTNNISVTYVPGRTIVPDNILEGTKDLIRANFRPQLGGNRTPYDTVSEPRSEPGQLLRGYFVPNSVMERLRPSQQGPFCL